MAVQVGFANSLCPILGMRHVVSHISLFLTNLTSVSHIEHELYQTLGTYATATAEK